MFINVWSKLSMFINVLEQVKYVYKRVVSKLSVYGAS